jgi:hypothetical protein
LFFLGHMAWAIVFGLTLAKLLKTKIIIPVLLVLAILPDFDLFIEEIIGHHTLTHSIFFWIILLSPFLIIYRQTFIPYFIGVIQHFAFGDFLIGRVMLFWPFTTSYFGLRIPMMSSLNIALEITGLFIAIGLLLYTGYLKQLLSQQKRNILMLLPLLAIIISMFFLTVDFQILPLVNQLWNSIPLNMPFIAILLAHTTLAIILLLSSIQGLRALIKKH